MERGWGVMGGLAEFVKYYTIGGWERGGVVAEGHDRGEESQDDFGADEVDPFPYRVGDPIRAGGRGEGRLGQG